MPFESHHPLSLTHLNPSPSPQPQSLRHPRFVSLPPLMFLPTLFLSYPSPLEHSHSTPHRRMPQPLPPQSISPLPSPSSTFSRHVLLPLCRPQGLRIAGNYHTLSSPGPPLPSLRVKQGQGGASPLYPRGVPLAFYQAPLGDTPLVHDMRPRGGGELAIQSARLATIKVYQGDFQGTLTLARAPRAQAKKIEERNLGFFPRYLPHYCAAQCSVGFMASFFCCLIGSSATQLAK